MSAWELDDGHGQHWRAGQNRRQQLSLRAQNCPEGVRFVHEVDPVSTLISMLGEPTDEAGVHFQLSLGAGASRRLGDAIGGEAQPLDDTELAVTEVVPVVPAHSPEGDRLPLFRNPDLARGRVMNRVFAAHHVLTLLCVISRHPIVRHLETAPGRHGEDNHDELRRPPVDPIAHKAGALVPPSNTRHGRVHDRVGEGRGLWQVCFGHSACSLKVPVADEVLGAPQPVGADRRCRCHGARGHERAPVENEQVRDVVTAPITVDDRGRGVVAHSGSSEQVPAPCGPVEVDGLHCPAREVRLPRSLGLPGKVRPPVRVDAEVDLRGRDTVRIRELRRETHSILLVRQVLDPNPPVKGVPEGALAKRVVPCAPTFVEGPVVEIAEEPCRPPLGEGVPLSTTREPTRLIGVGELEREERSPGRPSPTAQLVLVDPEDADVGVQHEASSDEA